MPAQIAVLQALSADLFDPVPMDKMGAAERAVHEAAAKLPVEIVSRLESAEKLSDADRETIVGIARKALQAFLPEPGPGSSSAPNLN